MTQDRSSRPETLPPLGSALAELGRRIGLVSQPFLYHRALLSRSQHFLRAVIDGDATDEAVLNQVDL